MSKAGTLLAVRDLRTYFSTEDGLVKAVDGVNFRVAPGQTFALVGESGCGKSVTAYSILRLLQMPPAFIASRRFAASQPRRMTDIFPAMSDQAALGGTAKRDEREAGRYSSINFDGADLLDLSERQMRNVRGSQIAMIFQEPMSSLNPVFTIGNQIVEAIALHRKVSAAEARRQAVTLLEQVGIPDPDERFDEYPHQLSGGMRQRAMIAMALSCSPRLLIADEPTTALDVTIQAQILDLLSDLQQRTSLSILLITHDLAVVAETAEVVAVMYAGQIVELADVDALFASPLHPYTQGLMRCIPRLGQTAEALEPIAGTVANPLAYPNGCRFHPRCPIGRDLPRCQTLLPSLREVQSGHWAACWECPGYEHAPLTDPSQERP